MSAIYYDQGSDIKTKQCKTIVTFDTIPESKILDTGDLLILSNFQKPWTVTCKDVSGVFEIEYSTYHILNRSELCECSLTAGNYLLSYTNINCGNTPEARDGYFTTYYSFNKIVLDVITKKFDIQVDQNTKTQAALLHDDIPGYDLPTIDFVQTSKDNDEDVSILDEDNPQIYAHLNNVLRKTYAPADTIGKDLTKQRQAQILKNQQEKERAKAQALENRDKTDETNGNKSKKPTAQPEDNSNNIDDSNNPRTQKSKCKASHPDQVKNSKKGKGTPRACENARVLNDPPLDLDTQDEDILITDEYNPIDDSEYAVGPDEIGFYTFFLEGQGNPPDLMGIEDDQLLAIQNDLCERLKAREKTVSNKLCELEQKHEFANTQFLKNFAQVSELLEPTAKDAQAKVKLADKMLMLPPLFDGEKPEKENTYYERLNQYIKFQTKEVNIKDTTRKLLNYLSIH